MLNIIMHILIVSGMLFCMYSFLDTSDIDYLILTTLLAIMGRIDLLGSDIDKIKGVK